MEGVGYKMRKARGSLTVIALAFLILISVTLSYQLTVCHSKLAINHSLIQNYQNRRNRKLN